MRSSLRLAVLSLITLAFASNQLPIYLPGVASYADLFASVSTVPNPSTTILVIPCLTQGINDLLANQECGSSGLAYSIISTTIYQATLGPAATFVCKHETASKEMSCEYAFADITTFTATYPNTQDGDFNFVTASITKGAESLSEFTGSATATTTSEGTGKASETQATSSAAPATPTSGAALKYGIEGSGLFALAGAAALNAW